MFERVAIRIIYLISILASLAILYKIIVYNYSLVHTAIAVVFIIAILYTANKLIKYIFY